MKKSLITIALAVGFSLAAVHAAKADTIGFIEIRNGGAIRITDDTSRICQVYQKHAYIVGSGGEIKARGCWRFVESETSVEIVWDDNTQYVYPSKNFYVTDYGTNAGYNRTTTQRNTKGML